MDPEQTFIRVQERFSQMLTPRIRTALEYIYLILGIALFCLLVVMHANYVQQPGCSSELSVVETAEAQLVHIKITTMLHSHNEAESDVMNFPERFPSTENVEVSTVEGFGLTVLGAKFWLNWIGSGARRSKLVLKSLKTDDEYLESQADTLADSSSTTVSDEKVTGVALDESPISFLISATESLKAAVDHFYSKWKMRFLVFSGHIHSMWDTIKNVSGMNMLTDIPKWLHGFRLDGINLFAVEWLEKRGRSFEPTYLYTVEKGYFLLPEGAKSRHGIHTVNISISARDSCFGNRWQQLLINRFVGYDTILMNSLLSSPGQGYLYNYQTKEFFDLSYAHEPTEGSTRFGDYLVTKCGVLIMSLFVFFTTTMSVSFTLRETQARMLKFTVQLEHHARHRLPTFQLIFVHVIESLVFVPIMIGILFFLFEFYDDQLLAFMVLILVWLSELFTLIRRLGVARDYIDYGKISRIGSKSVRTSISMKFFPRFFLLYFLVFHIYFFSYPYGFSYLAFAATALFMQHLILYFWNRFEVPALQRFMQNRRSQFQQQPDIHITSSTILASTLHITRLNMRSPATSGNLASAPGTRLGSDQVWLPNVAVEAPDVRAPSETSPANSRDSVHEPSDTQPAEAPSNPGSMNSFSSLLLWLLGGASSESLNSFLSLFRDVRHQSQVYPEPLPQENPAT